MTLSEPTDFKFTTVKLFAERHLESKGYFDKQINEYRARNAGSTTGLFQTDTTQMQQALSQGYLSDLMKAQLAALPPDLRTKVLQNPKMLAWIEKFIDPYDYEYKIRLVNAYENDHIIQSAIDRKIDFIFGRQTGFEFRPLLSMFNINQSPAEAKQALDAVLGQSDRDSLQKFVSKVDYITEFQPTSKALCVSGMVGGRGGAFIEKFDEPNKYGFPEGTPMILKPLNFTYMQQVGVHPDSWDLLYVRYMDFPQDRQYIAAQDLLYVTRNDNHITPLSLYYGRSDLRPILALSEVNRMLNEQDFPEIAAKMWAGTGVWKINSMDDAQIKKFGQSILPGVTAVVNQQAEYIPVAISHDIRGLLELRSNNIIEILAQLNIPSPLMNREAMTNRATMEEVIKAWTASVLSEERNWWGAMINRQWYMTLLSLWYTQNGGSKNLEGTNDATDIEELGYEIVITFLDVILETFQSKAQGLVFLQQAGLLQFIPLEKQLQFIGWDDIIEAAKEMQQQNQIAQQKAQEIQQQKMNMQQQLVQKGVNPFGQQSTSEQAQQQSKA